MRTPSKRLDCLASSGSAGAPLVRSGRQHGQWPSPPGAGLLSFVILVELYLSGSRSGRRPRPAEMEAELGRPRRADTSASRMIEPGAADLRSLTVFRPLSTTRPASDAASITVVELPHAEADEVIATLGPPRFLLDAGRVDSRSTTTYRRRSQVVAGPTDRIEHLSAKGPSTPGRSARAGAPGLVGDGSSRRRARRLWRRLQFDADAVALGASGALHANRRRSAGAAGRV